MGKQKNMTCKICGAQYYSCKTCEENRGVWQSWRLFTDTPEHYQLFMLLSEYGSGHLSKSDAAEALTAFDLSDMDGWNPVVKAQIESILVEPVVSEEKKEQNVSRAPKPATTKTVRKTR